MSTMQDTIKRPSYSSDISEKGWQLLYPLLPKSKSGTSKGGRPASDLREIVNAIFYVVKSGCTWRDLPNDFPNWSTVYGYFDDWSKNGTWEMINQWMVQKSRKDLAERETRPSASCIDSQSVKTTMSRAQERGFDGGKCIKGRKRFILTDTQGLLLVVFVCAANISEKAGAKKLLMYAKKKLSLRYLCSRIKLVWADGGYRGDELKNWVTKTWGWAWEVVLRSDDKKGFVVIPRRWVVERTFAWLSNNRRLSKDYEITTLNSQSMIYVASIKLMLNRF